MKKILCILLLVPFCAFSQDKGIHFETGLSWDLVKKKAKAENKYIFLDCFATWCGPCKAMDKDVYSDENVGDYFNTHFICVKVQFDKSNLDDNQVKSWYADVAILNQDYKVNAYPTFLFFAPDGSIVHRGVGYHNVTDFLALGKQAGDPRQQYYGLLKKFRQGTLPDSAIKSLAYTADSFGENALAADIANKYLNGLTANDLYTPSNIKFMLDFTKSSKDKGFEVCLNHALEIHHADTTVATAQIKDLLERLIYGEDMKPYKASKQGRPDWVKMQEGVKQYGIIGSETYNLYRPGLLFDLEIKPLLIENSDWNKILPLIEGKHAGKGEEFLIGSSVVYYINAINTGTEKNCRNFIAAGTLYAKKYDSFLSADALNTWAWTIFQFSQDKHELETGLAWSKMAMDKQSKDAPTNTTWQANETDTYANLLNKLGRKDEAIIWEGKAAKLDPNNVVVQNNYAKMIAK